MSSPNVETHFDGTCERVEYRCSVSDRYIDPCSCFSYYECLTGGTNIIKQPCPTGTAYDHTAQDGNFCKREEDVIIDGTCIQNEPWNRCREEAPNADIDSIKATCLGSNSSLTTTPDPHGDTADNSSGSDAGVIVGVIIAVLIILVLIVLIVLYVRKRGNPLKHLKESGFWRNGFSGTKPAATDRTPPHISTPKYLDSTVEGLDETYAVIEDTAVYKKPEQARHSTASISHANETYDRDDEEILGVTYDNPGLKMDDEGPPIRTNRALPDTTRLEDGIEAPNESISEPRSEIPVGEDGYLMSSVRGTAVSDPDYHVLEPEA